MKNGDFVDFVYKTVTFKGINDNILQETYNYLQCTLCITWSMTIGHHPHHHHGDPNLYSWPVASSAALGTRAVQQ